MCLQRLHRGPLIPAGEWRKGHCAPTKPAPQRQPKPPRPPHSAAPFAQVGSRSLESLCREGESLQGRAWQALGSIHPAPLSIVPACLCKSKTPSITPTLPVLGTTTQNQACRLLSRIEARQVPFPPPLPLHLLVVESYRFDSPMWRVVKGTRLCHKTSKCQEPRRESDHAARTRSARINK